MKIYNAKLFQANYQILTGEITIEDGRITSVSSSSDQTANYSDMDLDAHGLIVSPGWIDLQINGGFGVDFTTDPATIWEAGAKLPMYGVTGFLPTIITSPYNTYQRAIEAWRKGPPDGYEGARPLGLHFEGPFLNIQKKGAHNPDCIQPPDIDFIHNWSRDHGVLLVTMAPEVPGALDLARELHSRGIILSAGHSQASLEEIKDAVEVGYTCATHLFNAMPALDHRAPGMMAAALLDRRITPSIIADGVHVHPEMVKLAWRLCGAAGLVLITDAVGALGLPPGHFLQGGMEIVVGEDAARLTNGTLAGSVLSLDKALRNIMAYTGDPIEQILPALSTTQARVLGLDGFGKIETGYHADLTLLDELGQVHLTMVAGEIVFRKGI